MKFKFFSFLYKGLALVLKIYETIFKVKTNYIHFAIKSFWKKRKSIIIEVGSHNGCDTILLSSISKLLEIHTFEADPRLKKFLYNKFKNKRNITFYPYAVTFLKKPQKFYASKALDKNFKNTGSSSIIKTKDLIASESIFTVPTIALDDVRALHEFEIFLIWVDVQGAENQVIKSGISLFKSAKLLWIEYGESEYEEFLSREELINLFEKTHYVSLFSNRSKKGNLLLIKK